MTVRIANDVGLDKINKKAKLLNIYKDTANILSSSLGSGETTLIKNDFSLWNFCKRWKEN
jgi:membrane carboxypeptidase/penicillin-binding protein